MLDIQKYVQFAPDTTPDKAMYVEHIKSELMQNSGKVPQNQIETDFLFALQTSAECGLNPLKREIYYVYRKNQGKFNLTIMTSIDGLRAIAERSGSYGGSDAPKYEFEGTKLFKATVTVKKVIQGIIVETSATAKYSEYVGLTLQGVPNKFWKEKPEIMLAKCAEALALRKAFPNTAKIYIQEEMPAVERVKVDAKVANKYAKELSLNHKEENSEVKQEESAQEETETEEEEEATTENIVEEGDKEAMDAILIAVLNSIKKETTIKGLLNYYEGLSPDVQEASKNIFSKRRKEIERDDATE